MIGEICEADVEERVLTFIITSMKSSYMRFCLYMDRTF